MNKNKRIRQKVRIKIETLRHVVSFSVFNYELSLYKKFDIIIGQVNYAFNLNLYRRYTNDFIWSQTEES
jgi:hypothetical protein